MISEPPKRLRSSCGSKGNGVRVRQIAKPPFNAICGDRPVTKALLTEIGSLSRLRIRDRNEVRHRQPARARDDGLIIDRRRAM